MDEKHSVYKKRFGGVLIDIYRIFVLFEVTNPSIQHAVKKLIVAGKRNGGKSEVQDIQEAIDTLERYKEMKEEDRKFYELNK